LNTNLETNRNRLPKRLPGDRRHGQRSPSLAEGIVLDAQTLGQLREWAGMKFKIKSPSP